MSTSEELLYPPALENDETLHISAFSARRITYKTAYTFLDVGYDHC
jgi:hypothetical protein